MMAKTFSFIFLFFILISFASATTTIFSENFEYVDAFTNHGWGQTNTGVCTSFPTTPIVVNGLSGTSFGLNQNMASCISELNYNISQNITSGIVSLSVNYYINSNTTTTIPYEQISFQSNYRQVASSLRIYRGETRAVVQMDTGGMCNVNISDYHSFYNSSIEYTMEWDLDNSRISLFINDLITNCSNVAMTPAHQNVMGVQTFHSLSNTANVYSSFDNIVLTTGGVTSSNCSYPVLFCDDFNYVSPIINRGWQPQTIGGAILSTLTPENFLLNLNLNITENIYHETETFNQNYAKSSQETIINGYNSPIFSSQFLVSVKNTPSLDVDLCFRYLAFDVGDDELYDIAFCPNGTIYFMNGTQYDVLCSACFYNTSNYNVKINTKFSQRNNFDFNSSFNNDSIDVIVGTSKYTINGFVNPNAYNAQKYILLKSDSSNATIDDYYVMVGTDKYTDTSYNYLTQIYTPPQINVTPTGGGTGDFAQDVQNIWSTFGLKSVASRVLFALLMMFVTAIVYVLFMVAMSAQSQVPMNVSAVILMLIEVFEVFIWFYTGLLPLWILFMIGIIGILVVILFLITRARGG